MKAHRNPHKLKPPPRHLFSCGFFRHCTQTIPSPTTPNSPPPQSLQTDHLPPPSQQQQQPHQLQPPPPPHQDSSNSSTTTSSSSTSQSFTQWRFPTPISPQQHHPSTSSTTSSSNNAELEDLFHLSIHQLSSGSYSDSVTALHSLESSLVPNPQPICPPPELIRGVTKMLSHPPPAAKSATKILLALCLAEQNRRVAVQVGAVGGVVEAVAQMERATAERALAALELMCTVIEGAEELRLHALAVPMMVEMMGRLEGFRGKEYAISVLAVVYNESEAAKHVSAEAPPPEEVARAVALALQGECSARGRRKGALLLKILKGEDQRLDVQPTVAIN